MPQAPTEIARPSTGRSPASDRRLERPLRLRDLVLSQVLNVVGNSWVGIAAEVGRAQFLVWIIAFLFFYAPMAVAVYHLNRQMPLEGGLYEWARRSFGDAVGFMKAWNIWAYAITCGLSLHASEVIIATGARFSVAQFDRFEGQGIHYAATAMELSLCKGEQVIVVGAGNSAGQAAVYLSQSAEHVHVLVRGSGLASTMSDYLVRRIQQSRKVTVHPYSEIKALDGDERMRSVTLAHQTTGASRDISVGNRFLMIGAEPTGWLKGSLAHDSKGFIQTGVNADGAALASIYQTSAPGILAIGDVRSRSIKRVAAAVGEGVAAVHAVQHFLNPPVI